MANNAAPGSDDGGDQLPEFLDGTVQLHLGDSPSASGVTGPHQIWFPKSKAAVGKAVSLARSVKTFVRSGIQAAASDVVDATGGVVIDLASLNNVHVKGGSLTAEPGATTRKVANHLAEHGLVLPLADRPLKSIASSVLGDGPSCLLRTLGPLSKYVDKLSAVSSSGRAMKRTVESALEELRDDRAVMTGVSFKPVSNKPLWTIRKSIPYPGNEMFAALAKSLFLNPKIPKGSDVVLDAFSTRYDLPVVRITASGSGKRYRAAVEAVVDTALAGLPADFADDVITEAYAGPDVLPALVEAGASIPFDPQVDTRRLGRVVELGEDVNAVLDRVAEDVYRGLAFREDGKGKVDPDLRLFTRLQLDARNRLEISGLVYTPKPAALAFPAVLGSVDFLKRRDLPFHAGIAFGFTRPERIPGFRGEVYIPSDGRYEAAAEQYATTSFPPAVMSPFMVAYPEDEADVTKAIAFARDKGKAVAARSGGHQYCGTSSGGDGTIVLSMDAFDDIREVTKTVFDVGPAAQLTDLAATFKHKGVTIPHGECPLVCVGGHFQTGGYGHLLRAFGLSLDRVKAFTIVLADGTVRTVERPTGPPASDDDELYWGVLGGNAGSFGVVTNYRVEAIDEDDHPHSYGYATLGRYKKALYMDVMKQAQQWTKDVAAKTLRPDIDFMMTVESRSRFYVPPVPVMLVELVHSNLGGPGEVVDGDQVFMPVINAAGGLSDRWTWKRLHGTTLLSDLSDFFVRRVPETTWHGREFDLPYKKRVNCTTDALTDAFVAGLVDLVDRVVTSEKGVYLVFQMSVGGGNYQSSNGRVVTSIPNRDYSFCFVFDLFYQNGHEADANRLQAEMETLVKTHFSGGREHKLFWGSYGNIEITDPEVRDSYYDSTSDYPRLQRLKQKVDPGDLFRTPLTVKLP